MRDHTIAGSSSTTHTLYTTTTVTKYNLLGMGGGDLQLQELLQTDFCRFESPTGLVVSSSITSDGLTSCRAKGIDCFLASDQLIYLFEKPTTCPSAASSSPSASSQVTMDEDWSSDFLNNAMKLQPESMLLVNNLSDAQQQQPWYEINQSSEGYGLYPYSYERFEAPSGSVISRPAREGMPHFARNDQQYPVSHFDHHSGTPNHYSCLRSVSEGSVTDHQSHLPVSTRPQTIISKSSKTAVTAKRKGPAAVKKSEQDVKKRHRTESSSSSSSVPSNNKVGKEKMGNRITTLQQLVSPFGKTDTASVLSECIEYIRFLHEQVSVLSTPYMTKNGVEMQHFQDLDDSFYKDCVSSTSSSENGLKSRGLCIVPISSTYPLTRKTPVDFCTPAFGGS